MDDNTQENDKLNEAEMEEPANTAAATVEGMEPDPFAPKKNWKPFAIAGAAALAIALIAGAAFALGDDPEPEAPPAPVTAKAEKKTPATPVKAKEEKEEATLSVKVTCDGWDEKTSTPIVVAAYEGDVKDVLTSTDEGVEAPTALETVEAKAGEETAFEKAEKAGTYTLAIIGSPVLEDGTIFEVPEPQVVNFDDEDAVVKFELKKKDAKDVTEADIDAAKAAAEVAGADTATIAANTGKTHSSAEKAQGGTVDKGKAPAVSKPSSNTPSTSKPSGSTDKPSKPSGSTTTQPSEPSKPAHTHSWTYHEATYKTVHHDAVYKTVHHDAVKAYICSCGVVDPSFEHEEQHALNGEECWTSYKTVQEAYDENVCVSEAWDEQVLVSNAYYSCSCGATK